MCDSIRISMNELSLILAVSSTSTMLYYAGGGDDVYVVIVVIVIYVAWSQNLETKSFPRSSSYINIQEL